MKKPPEEEVERWNAIGFRLAPYPEWTECEPFRGSLTAARADLAHSIADFLDAWAELVPWVGHALERKADEMRAQWEYEFVDKEDSE